EQVRERPVPSFSPVHLFTSSPVHLFSPHATLTSHANLFLSRTTCQGLPPTGQLPGRRAGRPGGPMAEREHAPAVPGVPPHRRWALSGAAAGVQPGEGPPASSPPAVAGGAGCDPGGAARRGGAVRAARGRGAPDRDPERGAPPAGASPLRRPPYLQA